METNKKQLWAIYIVALFVFSIGLLEGLSFVYLRYFAKDFIPSPNTIVNRLDHDWLERYYKTTFDPNLGWQPKPNYSAQRKNSAGDSWEITIDEFGARRNPIFQSSLTPYVATFGDSWTFCDEVDDDETWQYYLSEILGRNVANYGVGGYGTDQAYLRYVEKLNDGLSPTFAILGIYEENFKRVLNRFRPFYSLKTEIKLGFKPRAYLDRSGNLSFLQSELKFPVYEKHMLVNLVEAARTNDFWASFRPWARFPFSLNLFYAANRKFCIKYPSMCPVRAAKKPRWDSPYVRSLMKALVIEFARTSKAKNIQPVVLFLSRNKPSSYSSFVKEMRKQFFDREAIIIDITDAEFDLSRYRILPDGGHASPRGNKLIAKHIAQYLPTK